MSKSKRRGKFDEQEKQAIIDAVFESMRNGPADSLTQACRDQKVSAGQFLTWIEKGDDELKELYARARVRLLDRMAEGLIDISDADPLTLPSGGVDSAAVAHRKLQIDTRKWLLSKLAPRKYGDRLELSGDSENPLTIKTIERVVVKND